MNWKAYLQYQKPMAHVLIAASLPTLAGIYNFGWRTLAVVVVSMGTCWGVEYLFTRQNKKPATMASLVTGILLALVCPPNIPFWVVIVGAAFAIVFGKMTFGGFGKNVFNPAMVGRCFLYICFPAFMVTAWFAPFSWIGEDGSVQVAGFANWQPHVQARSADEDPYTVDAVTSATTLRMAKNLNNKARKGARQIAASNGTADMSVRETVRRSHEAFTGISIRNLVIGNINGCMGETSSVAIGLALAYLLYQRVLFLSLILGPVIGFVIGLVGLKLTGVIVMPFWQTLLISMFAGGSMFAITFMTTEPVSAPKHPKARWIYGILIGVFAMIIRALSVWPAGLMFSILLGNMFGPLIETGCEQVDAWVKSRQQEALP